MRATAERPQRSRGGTFDQRTSFDETGTTMLKWITCYLSGRHDYQVRCEPGNVFLRCHNCGKRSMGWELRAEAQIEARVPVTAGPPRVATPARAAR